MDNCPICGEELTRTDDGIKLCLDCGYFHDPTPKEILQDIENQCLENLLWDIPVDFIFDFGMETTKRLRRETSQMVFGEILKVGRCSEINLN